MVDLYDERRGVQADGAPAVPAQAEVVKPLAAMGCTSTDQEIGMSAEIEMVRPLAAAPPPARALLAPRTPPAAPPATRAAKRDPGASR